MKRLLDEPAPPAAAEVPWADLLAVVVSHLFATPGGEPLLELARDYPWRRERGGVGVRALSACLSVCRDWHHWLATPRHTAFLAHIHAERCPVCHYRFVAAHCWDCDTTLCANHSSYCVHCDRAACNTCAVHFCRDDAFSFCHGCNAAYCAMCRAALAQELGEVIASDAGQCITCSPEWRNKIARF